LIRDKENRIKSATIDTMNTIKVTVNKVFDLAQIKDGIKLSQGTIADVTTTKDAPTALTITTKEAIDLKTPLTVTLPGYGDATASIGAVVRTDAFDQAFAFNGQLGALYTDAETTFRLWAPTATKVDLVTYQGTAADSPVKATVPMTAGEKGTWSAQLPSKQSGTVYTYHLTFPDGTTC
jgi:pullulanase